MRALPLLASLVLLAVCCRAQTQTAARPIRVKIEATEWDRRMLLEKLNAHGPSHQMSFALADADYDYRIVFQTGQGTAQILFRGSGGSMNTSGATVDVFDQKGTELFKFDRQNRGTDPSATSAVAKEIIKRILLGFVPVELSDDSTVPLADIVKRAAICPEVTISANGSKSDYKLKAYKLEVRSSLGRFSLTLVNPGGDAVSPEMRSNSLDTALEDVCRAIRKDITNIRLRRPEPTGVTEQPSASRDSLSAPASSPEPSTANASAALATITVTSDPGGADIYTDGAFVGNVPATLKLNAGKHTVKLTLMGYKDWSRDLTILGGSEVHLTANLKRQGP